MNQYQGHSLEELQALSGAFQFFPSLTSLDLETLCTSPFYETVFTAVQEAGCRLNELKLGLLINLTPDLFEKIAAILHSFQEFKHLRLGVASFDGPAMTGLTHALKRPGNVPSVTTLTELTFFECSFNRDAIRLLRAFMHT
jgi:hypothetical protein